MGTTSRGGKGGGEDEGGGGPGGEGGGRGPGGARKSMVTMASWTLERGHGFPSLFSSWGRGTGGCQGKYGVKRRRREIEGTPAHRRGEPRRHLPEPPHSRRGARLRVLQFMRRREVRATAST